MEHPTTETAKPDLSPYWLKGDPKIKGDKFICPVKGCGGHCYFTGMVWPTYPEGYHHRCEKCSDHPVTTFGVFSRP